MPRLFILDIMLEGEDGYAILEHLKNRAETKGIPVIMLHGQDQRIRQSARVGHGGGRLRHQAVWRHGAVGRASRRSCAATATPKSAPSLRHRGIEIDPQKRRTTVDGEEVELTYKEFEPSTT